MAANGMSQMASGGERAAAALPDGAKAASSNGPSPPPGQEKGRSLGDRPFSFSLLLEGRQARRRRSWISRPAAPSAPASAGMATPGAMKGVRSACAAAGLDMGRDMARTAS